MGQIPACCELAPCFFVSAHCKGLSDSRKCFRTNTSWRNIRSVDSEQVSRRTKGADWKPLPSETGPEIETTHPAWLRPPLLGAARCTGSAGMGQFVTSTPSSNVTRELHENCAYLSVIQGMAKKWGQTGLGIGRFEGFRLESRSHPEAGLPEARSTRPAPQATEERSPRVGMTPWRWFGNRREFLRAQKKQEAPDRIGGLLA